MTDRYGAAKLSKIRAKFDRLRQAAHMTDDADVLDAWLGVEPYLGLVFAKATEKT